MPLEGRLLSAFVKRAEQLKKWQDSETNRTPADVPRQRPSRIKFPDGCVFLSACAAGDKEEVKHLLDEGADVDTINVDGLTALHQACIDNNLSMVKFLVEEGADVDKQDNEGWTPLHAAVSCGSVAITEYLIEKGANLVAINNDGELPIDLAENETVEELLQMEMEKQEIDSNTVRTLEEKIMLRDARNWFRTKKMEDNVHSRTGATALHVAAAKGYGEVLGLLMHAGADLNAQDYDGWTPLHAAAHWGQRIACRMLCENLANMNIRNNVDQTCFDVADADMVKLLEELRKMQESMQKERPEIKEILEKTARTPPMRKTSINRAVSAEKITAGSRPPPPEREVMKVKFSPLVEAQPPKIDRSRSEEAEARAERRPAGQKPAAIEELPEKEEVPWRRPRRYAISPPRNQEDEEEEEEEEEVEGEEEEKEERIRSPEADEMELEEEVIYRSSVPPVAGERPEMQRKAHAKRARETRRPTQGVTSEELKLAQKLLLEKVARKELEPGSEAPGSEDEDEEEEEREEEKTKKENKYGSRYVSAGSLPAARIGGSSSLAGSAEDLQNVDFKKLYFELKDENEELREKLRKSEENLDKTKEQLQKALQNNSRNEVEKKERRSLERKISEMEEEVKALAKVKNENEKLKAENRTLTRTVSKLSKKS